MIRSAIRRTASRSRTSSTDGADNRPAFRAGPACWPSHRGADRLRPRCDSSTAGYALRSRPADSRPCCSSRSKSSSLLRSSLTTSSRSVSATLLGVPRLRPASSGSSASTLDLLEHRIVFHLLLDAFLQRHQRQLQNFHRLDHPRCKHLLLSQLHLLAER